jgi:hypothetical protein
MELDDEGNEGNEPPQEPRHPVRRGIASVGVFDVRDEANHTDASTDVDKPRGQHGTESLTLLRQDHDGELRRKSLRNRPKMPLLICIVMEEWNLLGVVLEEGRIMGMIRNRIGIAFSAVAMSALLASGAGASTGRSAHVVAPPALRPDIVTAIGDSVMIDIAPALKRRIPNALIFAQTSQQFSSLLGPSGLLAQLRAHRQLGSTVIIALGTNGTITNPMVNEAMNRLAGARKVVFATNHGPKTSQYAYMINNNRSMKAATLRFKNVAIADWDAFAMPNPGWFYGDGIHMVIDGAGARAYAGLLAVATH